MKREAVLDVLGDPLAQALLHSRVLARLAYNGSDGYPRVVPIGYFWRGGEFIVCTAVNAPKVRALQINPKVALTVDTEAQPPHILLVRGTASVEIVDGVPPEYLEASKRYVPPEQWQEFEVQVRGLYEQMARITITPDWAKLIDFETRLPIALEQILAQRT